MATVSKRGELSDGILNVLDRQAREMKLRVPQDVFRKVYRGCTLAEVCQSDQDVVRAVWFAALGYRLR